MGKHPPLKSLFFEASIIYQSHFPQLFHSSQGRISATANPVLLRGRGRLLEATVSVWRPFDQRGQGATRMERGIHGWSSKWCLMLDKSLNVYKRNNRKQLRKTWREDHPNQILAGLFLEYNIGKTIL